MKFRTELTLLTTLFLAFIFAGCGASETKKKSFSLMVLQTVGDVTVTQKGKNTPAKIGMIIGLKDRLVTREGSVDLQTMSGSALRIRNHTTIIIQELASPGTGQANTFHISKGSLMANVKKKSSQEKFTIKTPTAIAGVRGTSFTVTINEKGKEPRVRVLDGSVAMSHRVQAMEGLEQKDIDKSPELKKLSRIQGQEVVLEEKTEGKLDPAMEDSLLKANTIIKSKGSLGSVTGNLKEDGRPQTKKVTLAADDILDQATLLTVDEKTYMEIAEYAAQGKEHPYLKELQKMRDTKQAEVLRQLQHRSAVRALSGEREIKQYYNKVVNIQLNDGTLYSGAVLTRTKDSLVIHTPKGIFTVKKKDIKSLK